MRRLAKWLYVLSAVLHILLYPLGFALIVLGFWKFGFWRGVLGVVLTTVALICVRVAMLTVSSLIISWLDPDFFS